MLGVEKRISSPLMIPTVTEKIVEIDSHVGCACSGLVADSKTLIDRARVEAQVCFGLTLDFDLSCIGLPVHLSNLASPTLAHPEPLVPLRREDAC